MMKKIGLLLLAFILVSCKPEVEEVRIISDFNFDWKFSKGDLLEAEKESFDDSNWTSLRLPHDWSISEVFVNDVASSHPDSIPGGIGWYRKKFNLPVESAKKITWVEFDGIYNHSDVWINGHHLGTRPYGYSPFSYDLTPYLKFGEEENVLAVRVDRTSFQDSRWYSGSGIYRNVKLVTASAVHIPQWGSFITVPDVSDGMARVEVAVELSNRSKEAAEVILNTTIYDPEMNRVGEMEEAVNLGPSDFISLKQSLSLDNPILWSIDSPNLYSAIHQVIHKGKVVDSFKTPFGIRTFRYDSESGFYLNGELVLFKGVCLHHDGGSVGAAVPSGVWERRLKILKEAGCNSIRTAHNPPSEEFLDLCDRLGFLVQDEAFDEFHNPKDKRNNYKQLKEEDVTRGYADSFEKWAEMDVKAMVKRDRNHPSVIQWSIGNEIEWTYSRYGSSTGYWDGKNDVNYYYDEPPYSVEKIKELFYSQEPDNYPLAETAQKLADWIREEDPSRPVTANLVIPSVSFFSGYSDALDIVGLSYRNSVYDYIHKLYPEKMIFGTENWGSWYEWKPVTEREFVPGIFLWTGINYLGETSRRSRRGSGSGLLDFAGFKKPRYHMYKTLWNEEPHVFLNTVKLDESDFKWNSGEEKVVYRRDEGWKYYLWGWQPFNYHWNYQDNDSTVVEVFTNQPEVELFLNNSSLGTKKLEDFEDRIIKWMVPFQAGSLRAVAVQGESQVEYRLQTSGKPDAIRIEADKEEIKADGYEVVHITAQLLDEDGNPVLHTEEEIHFQVEGPAQIIGSDNGSNTVRDNYASDKLLTANGKCLLIIQSEKEAGSITILASAKEIESNKIKIQLK